MKKIGLLLATFPFALTACGLDHFVAKKGYDKYKNEIEFVYGAENPVRYNSCRYVYVTGSGNQDAETYIGKIFYRINITFNSITSTIYTYYDSKTDYAPGYLTTVFKDTFDYVNVLMSDGALSGEIGTL